MGSRIGYGMLADVLIVLWIHRRSAQIAVVLGAALLIVAIGLSRLYLGVHCFRDVVGGYAAGLWRPSACISGLEVARRWPTGYGRRLLHRRRPDADLGATAGAGLIA